MNRRPRVLMSAFSCNPEKGSEPGVGHFFVSAMARHCDLTIITERIENRAAIERRQALDPVYGAVDFRYIDWPCVNADGNRLDDRGSLHFYRCLREWEKRAFALAAQLIEQQRFDVTHHVTMGGYREPGYLWKLPLPFIWGPVGGHVQMPWRYFPMLGLRGCLQHGVRNIGNAMQARFHPRVNAAARAAAAVVTSSSLDARAFERFQNVRAITIAEHGTEPVDAPARRRRNGAPLRIVWSGVHVPRKALPILLRALAQLPGDADIRVDILGDGPEAGRWKALASRLGVTGRCTWHGRLPRPGALAVMNRCDVLAMPSLIDATSSVLHEALSLGLPVICHASCGFVDVVDETCGILVPLRSARASAARFADAMLRMHRDEQFYNQLASGAHRRARESTSEDRAVQMLQIYERVLGRQLRVNRASLPLAELTVTS